MADVKKPLRHNQNSLSPNITESARDSSSSPQSVSCLNARVLATRGKHRPLLNLTRASGSSCITETQHPAPSTFEYTQVVQAEPGGGKSASSQCCRTARGVPVPSYAQPNSFVSDRIELNTNDVDCWLGGINGFVADALIHVQFAPSSADRIRSSPSPPWVSFPSYQNHRFFIRSSAKSHRRVTLTAVLSPAARGSITETQTSQDEEEDPDTKKTKTSTWKHEEIPDLLVMRADSGSAPAALQAPPLAWMFPHVHVVLRSGTALYDFACVSWNYTLNDWSTAGCSKGNASDGAMRCICNHTTSFAALQLIIDVFDYAEDLGLTPILGYSFEILGLVVTIIFLIQNKESLQSNKQVKIALLSLCGSLLGFIITFLTGAVQSDKADDEPPALKEPNVIPPTDEHVEPERISCTTVAFLLHFTLLATFMWISLYGHLMMRLTFKRQLPEYWTYLSLALGWGLPAVVGGITMAITYTTADPQGYRQEEFCWLAALDKNKHFDFGKPMFWGMILPGTLIVIYNFVILIRISLERGRKCPDHTR
ncbi:unnamed protein product [Pleuronectes platessa]|uniref:G-protein coupled receptors family 2 profile 2 domain-containing protein n=1 Tax=Pleuronectes platessa TaxID=8262 RepID=A0A9N7UXS5_PLEPL|nr:unnamed protein product [Pleuronectes platessa]